MHVLITGAGGRVGGMIAAALLAAGHRVTRLGRRPGEQEWDLSNRAPRLPPADALVHAALAHVPGAYRGGEGDDPERFTRLNRDGTLALFEAAREMRVIFLSSRAVYGDHRRGQTLREDDRPAPDSLYGVVKLAGEAALGPRGVSLRSTGIYGGRDHKWSGLFDAYLRGEPVAPRVGTEVHGDDLAAVVRLMLHRPEAGVFNVSDLVLDRHDLLKRVRALTGCPHPPPPRVEGPLPGVMATDRLRALGWRPGGRDRLDAFLASTFGG